MTPKGINWKTWLKNWTKWKTKSKNQDGIMKSFETIKQCDHIAWNAEKMQRVKTQKSQGLAMTK